MLNTPVTIQTPGQVSTWTGDCLHFPGVAGMGLDFFAGKWQVDSSMDSATPWHK